MARSPERRRTDDEVNDDGVRSVGVSLHDAGRLVGAAVMLMGTALFALLGIALRRKGWLFTGEMLTNIAFTASLTLSMPFWLMKGQSRKAQTAIVGGTLGLLVLIASLAQLA